LTAEDLDRDGTLRKHRLFIGEDTRRALDLVRDGAERDLASRDLDPVARL